MSSRREDGSSSRRNTTKGMSKSSAGGYRRRMSVDNRLEASMLQGSSSRLITDTSTPAYLHSSTTMTSTTARGSRRRHSVTASLPPAEYSPDNNTAANDDSGSGSGRLRTTTANSKKKMTPQEISEKRYTQKLRQAQDVLRQYNSKQIRHQHVVAPRTPGGATNKDKYKLISRVADETKLHEKQHQQQQQQHLLKAPRSSRRQSLAATEVDTRHFEQGSAMTPRGRRRYSMTASVAVGAPTASSRSSSRPEGSATATRLKKAFSDDAMPQPHPPHPHVPHVPRRLHSADPEVPPVMPKPNYNSNNHPHPHGRRTSPTRGDGSGSGSGRSRRRSMAAGFSSNISNDLSQSQTSLTDEPYPRHHHPQPHHHATRHSSIKDKNTPKNIRESIPLGVDSFRDLESSMPSLQALDLSIHTNSTAPGGKRVSSDSQSILTMATHETEETTTKNNRAAATAAVLRDAAQPKQQVLSLTVDNAFSHGQSQSVLLKDGSGNNNNNNNNRYDEDDYDDYDEDFDYGDEPDEASTICNSVGDSNHEKHRRTRSKRNYMTSTNGNNRSSSSLDKMSRSEGAGAHRRMPSDGSGGKGASRRSMGGGSYVEVSTRRRTASSNLDDSGLQEGTSSRRRNRSSSHHRSSSSGMSHSAREAGSSRRGSTRNLRVTKAHSSAGSDDERRQQRRASTSVRSLSTDRNMSRTGSARKMSSSQRSLTQRSRPDSPTLTQSPRRQKSATSLKGDSSSVTKSPRRTKKQGRSQSMALGSAANAAVGHLNLDSIDKKNKDIFQNNKSSSMSVGAGSLGSAKSGKGRRSKPRRHLSNGSGSSNGSGNGRRRTRDSPIDLPDAADMTDKGDLDASVTTPPTVSSSSADEKFTGPHDDFTAAFEDMTHGPNTFSLNAAEIDPFDDHIAPSGDPFGSGLPDPFHLSKPTKDGAFSLGHSKAEDIDPASSSFHMSSDFGDFGQASFGSVNFEVDKRAAPS